MEPQHEPHSSPVAPRHRRAVKGPAAGKRACVFSSAPACIWCRPVAHASIVAAFSALTMSRWPISPLPKSSTQLAAGQAHFGVTGEDLIREQVAVADQALSCSRRSASAAPMSLSPCRRPGSDVTTMADLDDVAASMRPAQRAAAARCDEVHQSDAPAFCGARRRRLPDCRKPWARPKAAPPPAPPRRSSTSPRPDRRWPRTA